MRTMPANVLSPAVVRATISNGAPTLTTPLHALSPARRDWVDDSPVSMDSSSSASSLNVPSTGTNSPLRTRRRSPGTMVSSATERHSPFSNRVARRGARPSSAVISRCARCCAYCSSARPLASINAITAAVRVSSSTIASPIASHASTSMPAWRLATAFASDTVNASRIGNVPASQAIRASDGSPNAMHTPPEASVTAATISSKRSIDQGIRDMTLFPITGHGLVCTARFRLQTAWPQSRKRGGKSVDLGQDGAPAAKRRHDTRLDVSQAACPFSRHNRNVTLDSVEPIPCRRWRFCSC